MTTTGIGNASASPNKIQSNKMQLKAEDFIHMMVTQLQNQDPTDPAKNSELLAQMSQIGQLESSNSLQDALKGMVLQNSLGSAGNLIGKMVRGLDANNEQINGQVTSVRVEDNNVFLDLDNGKSLQLDRVTNIAPASTATATAATAATAAA